MCVVVVSVYVLFPDAAIFRFFINKIRSAKSTKQKSLEILMMPLTGIICTNPLPYYYFPALPTPYLLFNFKKTNVIKKNTCN